MKKVYFATPVNGRTEPTLAEKKDAALARCIEVRSHLKQLHPDWVICYSFMVCPINQVLTEAEAMGRCVTLLMSCDMLILDVKTPFYANSHGCLLNSRGCMLENMTAQIYGIDTKELREILAEPKKIVK